jgi:hypothetical protein
MRWLLSLFLGLFIAWIIVLQVNKMRSTSYYTKGDVVEPGALDQVDESLVAVGLAQYPQVPSIMDSINKPVKYPGPGPAPSPKVIKGSLPDPNFTPNPALAAMAPSPQPTAPMSNKMASISSPTGFAVPSPAPGPASGPAPSPAPGPAPAPYGLTTAGSPIPSPSS